MPDNFNIEIINIDFRDHHQFQGVLTKVVEKASLHLARSLFSLSSVFHQSLNSLISEFELPIRSGELYSAYTQDYQNYPLFSTPTHQQAYHLGRINFILPSIVISGDTIEFRGFILFINNQHQSQRILAEGNYRIPIVEPHLTSNSSFLNRYETSNFSLIKHGDILLGDHHPYLHITSKFSITVQPHTTTHENNNNNNNNRNNIEKE